MGFSKKAFLGLIAVAGLFLAACTGATESTQDDVDTSQAQSTSVVETSQESTQGEADNSQALRASVVQTALQGGDPEFTEGALAWQAYWLSRDHFGPFVMASGLGVPFMPPMEMVGGAMQMVAQNPDDAVMMPQNMMPLQAVYASGSSDLVNDPRDFDPIDFEAFRLDSTTFDTTVSVRAQAQTMLKESQWAHSFATEHFGESGGDFGAQQRFIGMMVNMLAQMQGQYAMQNLMGTDGLYLDSDGELDYTGNWVMLHALSDIAGLTGAAGSRYANPDMHAVFDGAATGLLRALQSRQAGSIEEAATAIRALIYRAATANDDAVRDEALGKARSIADATLLDQDPVDLVERSALIVGLISIGAADGDSQYLDSADEAFKDILADFDPAHGVFRSKNVYNVDDIAWIIGALNWMTQKGALDSQEAAGAMLAKFFESTLSLAGLQLSAPPGKNGAMAGEWEKDLPSVVYYHPANTPPPPMVGKLPVPAEEITWNGTEWSVTSARFVTAGAMHLANELNWIGPLLGSVPFPKLTEN